MAEPYRLLITGAPDPDVAGLLERITAAIEARDPAAAATLIRELRAADPDEAERVVRLLAAALAEAAGPDGERDTTLVYAPEREHACDIDWTLVPWPPDATPPPPPGITQRYEMVHCFDDPGTVRQCPQCGKHWVAVRNRPGTAGVYWRPERRLERRRRERAARRRGLR